MRRHSLCAVFLSLCAMLVVVSSFTSFPGRRGLAGTTPSRISLPTSVRWKHVRPQESIQLKPSTQAQPLAAQALPLYFTLDQSYLPPRTLSLSPTLLGTAAALGAGMMLLGVAQEHFSPLRLSASIKRWAKATQAKMSPHTHTHTHTTHTHTAHTTPSQNVAPQRMSVSPTQRPPTQPHILTPSRPLPTAVNSAKAPLVAPTRPVTTTPTQTQTQRQPQKAPALLTTATQPTATRPAHTVKPTPSPIKPSQAQLPHKSVAASKGIPQSTLSSSMTTSSARSFPWAKCKLIAKNPLNEFYTEYTFQAMEDKPLSLHKAFGRQIILCGSDSAGNLLKQSFCPLLPTMLTKDSRRFKVLLDNRALTDSEGKQRSFALSVLPSLRPEEEEIAVKIGSPLLSYTGPEKSIRALTVVASSVGIVPVLQLLQRILRETKASELAVEQIELLWINDAKEGFFCDDEVAKLEKDFPKTFSCARVLDSGLRSESALKEKLLEALPQSESGRVAVVAAATPLLDKLSTALASRQYVRENIIRIEAGP